LKTASSKSNVTYFSVHGEDVSFASTSEALMSCVQTHLKYFRTKQASTVSPLSITFDVVDNLKDVPLTLSQSARNLFSRTGEAKKHFSWPDGPCEVHWDNNKLIAKFPLRGLLVIDGLRGEAHGYLVKPELLHPDLRVRFIHFALTELLKWKGYYTIHATALEKDGLGVLIPGYSGQGKTTTFLSLLRSGFKCLSDDHPFLHVNANGVEVLAFPVKIEVTKNTIGFFPELQNAGSFLHQGPGKKYFYVDDLYPGGTGHSSKAKILLFPRVVDSPTSHLEKLSKCQALEELLPQSLLVYDQGIARKEFQALTQLVQQTDCYRVYCGRNILELPKLVTPLLEKP